MLKASIAAVLDPVLARLHLLARVYGDNAKLLYEYDPEGRWNELCAKARCVVPEQADLGVSSVSVIAVGASARGYAELVAALACEGARQSRTLPTYAELARWAMQGTATRERLSLMDPQPKARFVPILFEARVGDEWLAVLSDLTQQHGGFLAVMDEEHVIWLLPEERLPEEPVFRETLEAAVMLAESELLGDARIAIGTALQGLGQMRDGYLQVMELMRIGRIHRPERFIFEHQGLLPERWAHQMPEGQLRQWCAQYPLEDREYFPQDLRQTVSALFDCNLNISETARMLYVHRNTLLYRLDKIHKITGLDLRRLDDAATMKLLLAMNRRLRAEG